MKNKSIFEWFQPELGTLLVPIIVAPPFELVRIVLTTPAASCCGGTLALPIPRRSVPPVVRRRSFEQRSVLILLLATTTLGRLLLPFPAFFFSLPIIPTSLTCICMSISCPRPCACVILREGAQYSATTLESFRSVSFLPNMWNEGMSMIAVVDPALDAVMR